MKTFYIVPTFVLFLICSFASNAFAKCENARLRWRLGDTVNVSPILTGGNCVWRLENSRDPILDAEVVTKPQHGALTISNRTTVRYAPARGYKGPDRFTWQRVGLRNGTTPDKVVINVTITVR